MLNTKYVNSPNPEELWYLSPESLENPQKAIFQFFDTYGLGSAHERLWQMVKQTFSSEESNGWNEVKRANCLHYYELMTELLNANYALFLKMRENKK
ncbi:hypothetical protein [Flavitalea sp.]|nr:hypothetical protein [Flavitalea sp.]